MNLQEKLKFCRVCENRKMDLSTGIVCGLTDAKPTFEDQCPDIKIDQNEADRLVKQERAATSYESSGGGFAPEQRGMKKGVLGGVLMMIIGAVWFVAGMAAGRIFFYPPILFVIGIVALVKGLAEGNYAGEKNKS